MRFSVPWSLRRRLDEAEAAVATAWNDHAASILGDALEAANEPTRTAVLKIIRDLHRRNALRDPVADILNAVSELAPDFATAVCARLGTEHNGGNR